MDPQEEAPGHARDEMLRRELRKTRYLIALAILFSATWICAAVGPSNTPAVLCGLAFFATLLSSMSDK